MLLSKIFYANYVYIIKNVCIDQNNEIVGLVL